MWNRFWFDKAAPEPLAAFRILFGIATVLSLLSLAPDLTLFLGTDPLPGVSGTMPRLGLLPADAPNAAVWLLYGVTLLSAVCVTLGLAPQRAALVLFVGLLTFFDRNSMMANQGDTVRRCMALYLVFADSGAVWSLDARRRGSRSEVSGWPLRLMQIQLATIYADAFLWKLTSPEWRDGTALTYVLRIVDESRFVIPYPPWSIPLLTWSSLLAEFALAFLIWPRPFRWPVLAVGVALHLGMALSLNVCFFQMTMLACLALFVPSAALRRGHSALGGWLRRGR